MLREAVITFEVLSFAEIKPETMGAEKKVSERFAGEQCGA